MGTAFKPHRSPVGRARPTAPGRLNRASPKAKAKACARDEELPLRTAPPHPLSVAAVGGPRREPMSLDRQCKIVLVGNGSVGKSSLVNRFRTEGFRPKYHQTARGRVDHPSLGAAAAFAEARSFRSFRRRRPISPRRDDAPRLVVAQVGVDFFERRLELRGAQAVRLQIWDIGGPRRGRRTPDVAAPSTRAVFVRRVERACASTSCRNSSQINSRAGGQSISSKMLPKYLYAAKVVLIVFRQCGYSQHTGRGDAAAEARIFRGDVRSRPARASGLRPHVGRIVPRRRRLADDAATRPRGTDERRRRRPGGETTTRPRNIHVAAAASPATRPRTSQLAAAAAPAGRATRATAAGKTRSRTSTRARR